MASEEAANQAREEHAELLDRLGAHAVAVDRVPGEREGGRRSFGVIAYLSGPPRGPVPSHLTVIHGGRSVQVPLVIQRQSEFRLE